MSRLRQDRVPLE